MESQKISRPKRKPAALTSLVTLAPLPASAMLAVLLLGTPGSVSAQASDASVISATPANRSSTQASSPADVIVGRKALMQEAGLVMIAVDAFVADTADSANTPPAADLQRAAQSLERLLLAFPHLFPPSTNLYDANDELPATAALPAIWQDLAAFNAANEAAIRAARALAAASTAAEERAAAAALRASCDGCHAVYMQAYAAPIVTDADRDIELDFDF